MSLNSDAHFFICMHACMYECMYVCMYVCKQHVYIPDSTVYSRLSLDVLDSSCTIPALSFFMTTSMALDVFLKVLWCMYVCKCVYACVCMQVCMRGSLHTYIHACMHASKAASPVRVSNKLFPSDYYIHTNKHTYIHLKLPHLFAFSTSFFPVTILCLMSSHSKRKRWHQLFATMLRASLTACNKTH